MDHWSEKARSLTRYFDRVLNGRKASPSDILYDDEYWGLWANAYYETLNDLVEAGVDIGVDQAVRQLEVTFSFGMDANALNPRVTTSAEKTSMKLVKGLTDTDKKNLRTQLSAWTQGREDFPSLVGRVDKIIKNPVRAKMIATTEATRVYARGNIVAWLESDVVNGKQWKTAQDESVCPICRGLHNQVSPLSVSGGAWGSKWRHPSADSAQNFGQYVENPPAHPNCRCVMAPWVKKMPKYSKPTGEVRPPGLALPGKPRRIPTVPAKPKVPKAPTGVRKPKGFPKDPTQMEHVRVLGGYTQAELVRDPKTGRLFVRKTGANPDHIRSEALADAMYQKMGANVPAFRLYETAQGPVKLAEYIPDAKTLGEWAQTATKREIALMKKKIQADFAQDAFLANWDVIGPKIDNILVDAKGQIWRIDSGGALLFKGVGLHKQPPLSPYVVDLWKMRDPARSAAQWFDDIPFENLVGQMEGIVGQRRALLNMIDDRELKALMGRRLDSLADIAKTSRTMSADLWNWDYIDEFTKHTVFMRDFGLIDNFPKKLTVKNYTLYDEHGMVWDHLRGRDSVMHDLQRYMEENGGNYSVVQHYLSRQGGSSWNGSPLAVKYHIASQRGAPMGNYYWRGNSLESVRDTYNKALNAVGGKEMFDNSYTAWHAFNYELVRNVKMPNNDLARGFIRIARTESQSVWNRVPNLKEEGGPYSQIMGAAESSSLFRTTCVSGHNACLYQVPHHRVWATYFPERTPGSGDHSLYGDSENEIVFIPEGLKFFYYGSVGSGQSIRSLFSRMSRFFKLVLPAELPGGE
jgi:hypothetical protein